MQKNKKEINDLLNRINDKNKLSRTRNPVYWNSSYIPMNNQEEFEIEVNPLIFEMTGSEWNGKLGNYLKFTEFKDENGTYKPVMEFNDDSVEKEIRKYFTNNILPNQINSINTQQTQGNSNSQNPDTSAQPSDDFNAFMVFLYGENDKKSYLLLNEKYDDIIFYKDDYKDFKNKQEIKDELDKNLKLDVSKLEELGIRHTAKFGYFWKSFNEYNDKYMSFIKKYKDEDLKKVINLGEFDDDLRKKLVNSLII